MARTDRAVEAAVDVAYDPMMMCRVRSIGHDWAGGTTRWTDGADVVQLLPEAGRRRRVYMTYATTDCPRCGTTRIEVFEQSGGWLTKKSNRYRYPKRWRELPVLTQPELQMMRMNNERPKRRRRRSG